MKFKSNVLLLMNDYNTKIQCEKNLDAKVMKLDGLA